VAIVCHSLQKVPAPQHCKSGIGKNQQHQEKLKGRKSRRTGKSEEQENQSIRKSRRAGKTGELEG
jgi:hypothetical protein